MYKLLSKLYHVIPCYTHLYFPTFCPSLHWSSQSNKSLLHCFLLKLFFVFFTKPTGKVLAPRVLFCTLGPHYLSGNLLFPRAFSSVHFLLPLDSCAFFAWPFTLWLVRYLYIGDWSLVFCGLPINRWCPGTLKIPGSLLLTLCLVVPPLWIVALGFSAVYL